MNLVYEGAAEKASVARVYWKVGESSIRADQRGSQGHIMEGLVNHGNICVIFMYQDVCYNMIYNSKQFLLMPY